MEYIQHIFKKCCRKKDIENDYDNILLNLKDSHKKYNPRKLFTASNAFLGLPKGNGPKIFQR